MGDTVYYNAPETITTSDTLSPEVQKMLQEMRQSQQQNFSPPEKPSDPGYTPFMLVMTSFVVLGYFAIKTAWKSKGTEILGGWNDKRETIRRGLFAEEKYSDADERFNDLTKDYLVYHGVDLVIPQEQYEKIIGKRIPYFNKLSPELKEKFINRTKKFLTSKTFLIKTNEPFLDMPVLISATAVQLTFGLDDYLLPHFQYIRIYPEEYFANGTMRVLAGHVYGNTVTLAWNHFLKGNEEYTDGVNVGLHEMAHALYYQYVEADVIKCRSFISNFNEVMAEGQEVYELKNSNPSQLFTNNAYRNLQEFWAESVELFFERPADLKRENSELYDSLADILNQDPINTLYPVLG